MKGWRKGWGGDGGKMGSWGVERFQVRRLWPGDWDFEEEGLLGQQGIGRAVKLSGLEILKDGEVSYIGRSWRFPSPETTGFPRLLEALAANDWESGAGDAPSPDLDLDLDYKDIDQEDNPEALLNGIEDPESREMRVPMIPRGAGNGEEGIGAEDADREGNGDDGDREGEGEEDSVEALQTLLLKMQAVKDLGADLPAAERRKLARRAVAEVMRGA